MMKQVALFLFIPFLLFAVSVEQFVLEVERTRLPENGSQIVRATLVTNGSAKVQQPEFPASSNYRVVEKTSQTSSSTSMSIINGQRSVKQEVITAFFYRIEFPKAGKVTLPALTVNVDGQSVSTKPVTITIGGSAAAEAASEEKALVTMNFVSAKKAVYKGEQLPMKLRFTWKVKQPVQLTNEGFSKVISEASKAMEKKFALTVTTKQPEVKPMTINGEQLYVVDLDISLSAIDTGTVIIKPIAFTYLMGKQVAAYDDFFGQMVSQMQTVEATGYTPKLVLSVKTPPNPPAGYTGIVGQVNLRGTVSSSTVKAGEGITLKYVLTGRMKGTELGEVEYPKLRDFEQFTPEKRTVADSSGGRISTKKEFSSMIIPQKKGSYSIPAISVIWFDPNSGKYHTETAGPFKINVLKGDGKAVAAKRYLTKEQIATVGTDIRFIKTKLVSGESLKPYRSPLLFLMPFPWIVALLIVLYKLSVKLMPAGDERIIRRGALGKAFRQLDKIESGKSKGSPAGVVEQYLLKKYAISAPSMRRDELRDSLAQKGASEPAIESLVAFLNSVEMSRYSGTSSGVTLAKEAKEVLRLITKEVQK